jgi:hypothetical protein
MFCVLSLKTFHKNGHFLFISLKNVIGDSRTITVICSHNTKLLARKWPFLTEVVIFYPSSEIGFPFSPNRIEGIPCFDVDFLSV